MSFPIGANTERRRFAGYAAFRFRDSAKISQFQMAIEFQCPNCAATVRVGDEAVGKVGSCPKCGTKLRVPNPNVSHQHQPQAEVRTEQTVPTEESTSDTAQPTYPNLSQPKQEAGVLPQVPIEDDPVTSKYLRKRRRKKSMSIVSIAMPLLFGGVLVLVALLYYGNTRPSYIGEVAGILIDPNRSLRVTISPDDYDVPAEQFASIVEEFQEQPGSLRSDLVSLQFTSEGELLNVSLRPGVGSDMIKVPLLTQESVKKFYAEYRAELDRERFAEIEKEFAALCEEWESVPEHLRDEKLAEYRHAVIYNSFVNGLGRICQAVVGSQAYPCVHENSEGEFFFLVPTGVKKFSIRERADLKEPGYFPTEFRIEVSVKDETATEKIEKQEVTSEEESTQQIEDETESKMSEDDEVSAETEAEE